MSVSVTALKSSSLSRFWPQTLRVAIAPSTKTVSCHRYLRARLSILQGGTVVVMFPIRQTGYLCALTLFARADLWSCQLCVTRKFVCCEHLLCGTGVTGRGRSYQMPVILTSHSAVNSLLGLGFTITQSLRSHIYPPQELLLSVYYNLWRSLLIEQISSFFVVTKWLWDLSLGMNFA